MGKIYTILDKSYSSSKTERKEIIDSIFSKISKGIIPLHINNEEMILTIDEAVTNAMEHGNRWNPQKQVHVRATVAEDELRIKITDEGNGFNSSGNSSIEDNRMRHRGRGITLIKQFSTPHWNKKGNEIELRIKLR